MFKNLLAKIKTAVTPQNKPLLSPIPASGQVVLPLDREQIARQYTGQIRQLTPEEAKVVFPQRAAAPSPSPAPVATPRYLPATGSANIDPALQAFIEQKVFPITRPQHIPDQVAAGQLAAEGGIGNGLGARRNNYYNINAIDSNPNAAHRYATPEEGVNSYAKLLATKYAPALQSGNSDQVLSGIEQGGYAGDPKTYAKRANNGYQSYSQFVKSTPAYRHYAK